MRIFRAAVIAHRGGDGGGLRQRRRAVPAVPSTKRTSTCRSTGRRRCTSTVRLRRSTRCAARRSTPIPQARVDRDAVRQFYTTPVTRVTAISESRRSGRRFVHVRLDVDDIRRLGEAAPFRWSRYDLRRDGRSQYLFYADDRRRGRQAGGRRRVERPRDRRVPAAPAEQDRLPQRRRRQPQARQHPRLGAVARPIACAACRSCSTRACRRSRFSTATLSLFGITCVAVAVMFGIVIVCGQAEWIARARRAGQGGEAG